MYCTNCGQGMDNNAAVCVNCGVPAFTTKNFCPNCGQAVTPIQAMCTNCGVQLPNAGGVKSQKSKLVAGLLGIFLGGFGVHRFYLGYTGLGVVQIIVTLVTCGVGSLWGFIEGILCLCGKMTDADGNELAE